MVIPELARVKIVKREKMTSSEQGVCAVNDNMRENERRKDNEK